MHLNNQCIPLGLQATCKFMSVHGRYALPEASLIGHDTHEVDYKTTSLKIQMDIDMGTQIRKLKILAVCEGLKSY